MTTGVYNLWNVHEPHLYVGEGLHANTCQTTGVGRLTDETFDGSACLRQSGTVRRGAGMRCDETTLRLTAIEIAPDRPASAPPTPPYPPACGGVGGVGGRAQRSKEAFACRLTIRACTRCGGRAAALYRPNRERHAAAGSGEARTRVTTPVLSNYADKPFTPHSPHARRLQPARRALRQRQSLVQCRG